MRGDKSIRYFFSEKIEILANKRCFFRYLLVIKKFDCDDEIHTSVQIYFYNLHYVRDNQSKVEMFAQTISTYF